MSNWPVEPYRIKMVEPLTAPDRSARAQALVAAGYNPFQLAADAVYIDLLTDSGTGAMSQAQWAAMLTADEAYAGSRSFALLQEAVRDVLGFPHILPVHQGRAAEHLLFTVLVAPGQTVPNNMHFDTTKAHVQHRGARPVDVLDPAGYEATSTQPFKGNVDIAALERLLSTADPGQVPLILVTVTCNSGGGQPVSLQNLRAVRAVADRYGVPLFLDAARFAENAWFIHQREPDYGNTTVPAIVREMMDLADGALVSGKKDALANIGGLLCLRDADLHRRCAEWGILFEGFPTYGGLAGRDLAAMAVGLREVVQPEYLAHRTGQVAALAARLRAAGVPLVEPPGGHAVYLDAGHILPHIPPNRFPAWALGVELYRAAGVRGVEVGTVLSGRDPATGEHDYARLELLRLAIPRRVYTAAHLEYVAEQVERLVAQADRVPGYRLVHEPAVLRHFSARFVPESGPPT